MGVQISLVLAISLLFIVNVRSRIDRTYKTTLALEFIILGLWIPTTYAIAMSLTAPPPQSTIVTLAFCGINLYVPSPNPVLKKTQLTREGRSAL